MISSVSSRVGFWTARALSTAQKSAYIAQAPSLYSISRLMSSEATKTESPATAKDSAESAIGASSSSSKQAETGSATQSPKDAVEGQIAEAPKGRQSPTARRKNKSLLPAIDNVGQNAYGWQNISLPEPITIPTVAEPEAKHNDLVCKLEFRGFMPDHLDFVSYFARYSAHVAGIPCDPVIHLRTNTQRWAVNKGPFVHAKTKELFERKTYKRLLQLYDASPETIELFVDYINKSLPAGVDMKVIHYEWQKLGFVSDWKLTAQEAEEVLFQDRVAAKSNELLAEMMKQKGGQKKSPAKVESSGKNAETSGKKAKASK
ncbi:ribosomal protein S10 domain-containing protein [Polychytrium aggregatum]|uniref:ribosomal protein S10 domain-containing protein n=1 Tax=Polychytrium aggregatum TaxID=110093 RepID=UPI0022FEE43F|nr:ribosomal protein S10 domain-containing protein [Polychytrium aggregatum]KAI9209399.1 ribosomal protein S10 domain-containing protein [Polychytrium aggregatum]